MGFFQNYLQDKQFISIILIHNLEFNSNLSEKPLITLNGILPNNLLMDQTSFEGHTLIQLSLNDSSIVIIT